MKNSEISKGDVLIKEDISLMMQGILLTEKAKQFLRNSKSVQMVNSQRSFPSQSSTLSQFWVILR